MTAPTFGDPAAIARYTPNPDHVYQLWELAELDWCPPGIKTAYYQALADLEDADEAQSHDLLWFASEAICDAEGFLRRWGKNQGYRVADDGVLEGNGKPSAAKTILVEKDGEG